MNTPDSQDRCDWSPHRGRAFEARGPTQSLLVSGFLAHVQRPFSIQPLPCQQQRGRAHTLSPGAQRAIQKSLSRFECFIADKTQIRSEPLDEIRELLQKYDSEYVRAHLRTTGDINAFALTFFKDTAEIRWRLQDKTFFQTFSEVIGKEWGAALYPSTYGMLSASIHGSWNESMDYCLTQNADGTFSTYALYQPADIRFVTTDNQVLQSGVRFVATGHWR
jgi:hypothetical protein